MSKPESQKPLSEQSISDRFESSLNLEGNKPDAKNFDHLSSPVSPLHTTAAAATSSSSSSSGSFSGKLLQNASIPAAKSDDAVRRNHSGELSGSNHGSPNRRPGHRRSGSEQLAFSSSANSPAANVLPAGNICPSGKIGKTGMMSRITARSDVLGSGSGNYGHGSIMRGSTGGVGKSLGNGDTSEMRNLRSTIVNPEEITKSGNQYYKKGQLTEALRLYDRAIKMCPGNAACWNNRGAALIGLGRLGEALKDCEEAIRINPSYAKAHYRLASLHLRFGQVELAQKHLLFSGQPPDLIEMQKIQMVEKHIERCADARRIGDWKSALREADTAITAGADSSPSITALRAEALLHLQNLKEADSIISKSPEMALKSIYSFQTKLFGLFSDSYICFVRAQVELALGRFDNAVALAQKALLIDPLNAEVSVMCSKVKSVAGARTQGNELFKSGNFAEACTAYGEGLKYDPSNSVLHCNRAACRYKLEQWERSLEDCNEALRNHPDYIKALLRRAASYTKLERWIEAVKDYEVLRKELPADTEVAEGLFHAQVGLKMSRGEVISDMKFGGEVEKITGFEQLQVAFVLPGVSVVYFMAASNHQCIQTTPWVDAICKRYPSLNFLKVDIIESPAVAIAEKVKIVPTIKIYRNGVSLKEMICPSFQALELSLRHYGI